MEEIKFNGNGQQTADIEEAFYRLLDDLKRLGARDASFWVKTSRNSQVKAIGRQIKNDAATLAGLKRAY